VRLLAAGFLPLGFLPLGFLPLGFLPLGFLTIAFLAVQTGLVRHALFRLARCVKLLGMDVLFIHGFAPPGIAICPIAFVLRRYGFRTECWDYSRFDEPVPALATELAGYLRQRERSGEDYCIVSHSMGGIIVRGMLETWRPRALQRLAFLAVPHSGILSSRNAPNRNAPNRNSPNRNSPNRNSPNRNASNRNASKDANRKPHPKQELSDELDHYVHSLKKNLPYPFCNFASRFDTLVSEQSTHLHGEAFHRSLIGTHNSLLLSPWVARDIALFFKTSMADEINLATT
jgi:hypothetical protein